MATLITGAGLVGSQIARILVENGERPVIYDISPNRQAFDSIVGLGEVDLIVGNILDLPLLLSTLRKHTVNKIIHTAAMLGSDCTVNPYQAVQTNIMGTVNVLEAGRLGSVERVVLASSGSVYEAFVKSEAKKPLNEDAPTNPWGIYAATKLACEHLGRVYSKRYGLDVFACRLGAVFGPWKGSLRSGTGAVFHQLFKDLADRGEAQIVKWYPDVIYSKDAARGLIMLLEAKNLEHDIYNISSGVRFNSVETFAALIRKGLPNLEIRIADETHVTGVSTCQPISNERARRDFGFIPEYPLEKAAIDYYEWVRSHSQTPRERMG